MKKILLIISVLLILSGCNNKINKFHLDDNYYGKSGLKEVSDLNEKDSFILFVYNNYCSLAIPCEAVFKQFSENENIEILSMPFNELKKTSYYDKVKYGPSILIIKKGKLVAYLDAENDDDLEKYQEVDKFTEWVKNYIYLSK